MDIRAILDQFWSIEDKNTFVADSSGNLVYQSEKNDLPADIVWDKINSISFDFDEQEFIDKEHSLYFSVRKTVVKYGGESWVCYHATDVSEYALLLREVSTYTKSISKMYKFQTSIMKKLSMSFDNFLPGLADYCMADEVVMFTEREGQITKSTYSGEQIIRFSEPNAEQYAGYYELKRGASINGLRCILNSEVQGIRCVVLVRTSVEMGAADLMDPSIHNVISLFIENSILREKIVYESEHDRLTNLYNKGKYLSMKSECFCCAETIAVYNFDINNLKHINDTYGHEYGDALIVKAAKSLHAVCSEKVFGFRIGGDEFIMVAVNVTKEEAEEIRRNWRSALDSLNEWDKDLFCSAACGMAFGSGDHIYDELYARADKLMYEEKKLLKSKGITSRIRSVSQDLS